MYNDFPVPFKYGRIIEHTKFSEKLTFVTPTCAYQRLNFSFSYIFAYVLNEWSLISLLKKSVIQQLCSLRGNKKTRLCKASHSNILFNSLHAFWSNEITLEGVKKKILTENYLRTPQLCGLKTGTIAGISSTNQIL